jgi:hypothetical protein
VRKHDGFYFRFGTGLGGYLETITPVGSVTAARASGIAGTVELAAGFTPLPGFVVGVGVYLERILASDMEQTDEYSGEVPTALLPSFRDTTLAGPLVDWYPDPDLGLHVQAAAGYFYLSRAAYTPGEYGSRDYSGNGLGAVVGLGQEWWISDQSSIGVTTQVMVSVAQGSSESAGEWEHLIVATPTFVFTWTYH